MPKLPPKMHKKHRVYYYVTRIAGKLKWIRLSDDYQEALHKYADLQGNVLNTGLVRDVITRYEIEVLKKLAPKTIKDRGYQLNKLRNVFGDMPLDAITPPHIQKYLDMREAKVSANREIKLFSTIYRHAISWGLCSSNPCKGAFYHQESGRDRLITDSEFQKIRSMADPMFQAMIDIAYLTGMRRGDILDLKLTDITDKGIYNVQNKTVKHGPVKQLFKWSDALRDAVKRAKTARKTRNITYLFTNTKGQKITVTGFNSMWRRLRDKTGIKDIHFHDIRAYSLTHAEDKGGLAYAQALGGHRNQSQTEHYIKNKKVKDIDPVK